MCEIQHKIFHCAAAGRGDDDDDDDDGTFRTLADKKVRNCSVVKNNLSSASCVVYAIDARAYSWRRGERALLPQRSIHSNYLSRLMQTLSFHADSRDQWQMLYNTIEQWIDDIRRGEGRSRTSDCSYVVFLIKRDDRSRVYFIYLHDVFCVPEL